MKQSDFAPRDFVDRLFSGVVFLLSRATAHNQDAPHGKTLKLSETIG
jgi:hypothetical protein